MLFIVDRQRLQSDKSVVSAALEEDREHLSDAISRNTQAKARLR